MAGLYVAIKFVIIFLDVLLLAMLVRAIMSWFFSGDGESPLLHLLYIVTEPLIIPVRILCQRFGWFQGTPIDMSFFITTLILSLINLILSGISPL